MDTLDAAALADRVTAALVGVYAIEGVAGVGGMSVVFRARRVSDQAVVAVKVLDPRLQRVLGQARFSREISILARLDHPGILPLLDSGEADGLAYLVMPLVTGGSLRDRLRDRGQLAIAESLGLIKDVLAALDYAHRANVLHRDIKPENILFQDGRPVVADFGIARAIVQSGGESISSTGFAVGTPAYMSPEQALGSSRLDGRSDLYAAACVLYEMLAGVPPFTGSSAQAVQARHLHDPLPPLRTVRPTVPVALERVITTALAKIPDDRFETAAAFGAALDATLTADPSITSAGVGRRWKPLGVAAGLVATAAVIGLLATRSGPSTSDSYAVLPFRTVGVDPASVSNGQDQARAISRALRDQWTDLTLIGDDEMAGRVSRSPASLREAAQAARRLGAGMLVWGEVERRANQTTVQATLYQVATEIPRVLGRAAMSLGPRDSAAALVAELAHRLVLGVGPRAEWRSFLRTASLRAARLVVAGDSLLQAWDLEGARARYRQAFTADPGFALAHLRYAQASLWADVPSAQWRAAVDAALTAADQLDQVSRLEVDAMAALAAGRYSDACREFHHLIQRDSTRFGGWFGLGECLTMDPVVIADRTSPSGWRFRSSYAAGVAAFLRALRLVPDAHVAYGGPALARLAAKLHAESGRNRLGTGEGTTVKFAAYPSLAADTLAFIPYPLGEVAAGKRTPASWRQAIDHNRRLLLELTAEWMIRFPSSVAAAEAHALALEIAGEVGTTAIGDSAIALVRRARRAGRASLGISRAAWEARLLLKARRFTAARSLAESTLAQPPNGIDDARRLASLAALIGRVSRAGELVAARPDPIFVSPAGELIELRGSIAGEARRLEILAAFGLEPDSIAALAARLESGILLSVEPARQASVRDAVFFLPRTLGFPLLQPVADSRLPIPNMERALTRGDLDTALEEYRLLAATRRSQPVADVSPDYSVLEARLLAMAVDTAGAKERLESLLGDLTYLGTDLSEVPTQAAAIGQGMALYRLLGGARLAGIDTALAALWRGADALLLQNLDRTTTLRHREAR